MATEAQKKTQFKKGEVNNPKGRPVGSGLNLTALLKQHLEQKPEGKKEYYKDLFIKTLLHKALIEKDIQALKLIINYCDGLPKQALDLTSGGKVIKGFNYLKPNGENNTDNSSAPETGQSVD